jgi:hypothetical protein
VPFDEQLRQQSLDFVCQAQKLLSQQKIPPLVQATTVATAVACATSACLTKWFI